MNVIGHDHITANGPAMATMCRAPFVDQNARDLVASENLSSIFCAHCHKINWSINPNAFQRPQMFVHLALVAEGVDLGQRGLQTSEGPRSATRGYNEETAVSDARLQLSVAKRTPLPDCKRKLFRLQPSRSG